MEAAPNPSLPVDIMTLVIGILLLILGRKLFWLFVAGAGFLIGTHYAPALFANAPEGMVIAAGLVLGLVGACAAIFIKKLAVRIAGFVSGAYLTDAFIGFMQLETGPLFWLYLAIGGIVGLLLMATLFEWALIFLSSFTGAHMVAYAIPMDPQYVVPVFVALTVVGIIVQIKMYSRGKAGG